MEDYIQIIFIAIFIISSIISSMNKKKKKQQAKMAKSMPTERQPVAANVKKKSSSQILEEILGLKIEIPEPPKKGAPVVSSNYGESNTTWDPTKEYEDISDDGYSNYENKISQKKAEYLINSNKHKAFKDDVVKVKPTQKNIYKEKIFSNNSNLKDYIVIQELLNKPKALRR
jgi:hypothetical protein